MVAEQQKPDRDNYASTEMTIVNRARDQAALFLQTWSPARIKALGDVTTFVRQLSPMERQIMAGIQRAADAPGLGNAMGLVASARANDERRKRDSDKWLNLAGGAYRPRFVAPRPSPPSPPSQDRTMPARRSTAASKNKSRPGAKRPTVEAVREIVAEQARVQELIQDGLSRRKVAAKLGLTYRRVQTIAKGLPPARSCRHSWQDLEEYDYNREGRSAGQAAKKRRPHSGQD